MEYLFTEEPWGKHKTKIASYQHLNGCWPTSCSCTTFCPTYSLHLLSWALGHSYPNSLSLTLEQRGLHQQDLLAVLELFQKGLASLFQVSIINNYSPFKLKNGKTRRSKPFCISGFAISKYRFSARILSGWNVVLGFMFFVSLMVFSMLGCPTSTIYGNTLPDSQVIDIRSECNTECRSVF